LFDDTDYSKNHPAFGGGIGAWFYTDVAGIEIHPNCLVFRPIPEYMKILGMIEGKVRTLKGLAYIHWEYNSGPSTKKSASVDLSVPVGYLAEFHVPVKVLYSDKLEAENLVIMESVEIVWQGSHQLFHNGRNGILSAEMNSDGNILFRLGSGDYKFKVF